MRSEQDPSSLTNSIKQGIEGAAAAAVAAEESEDDEMDSQSRRISAALTIHMQLCRCIMSAQSGMCWQSCLCCCFALHRH